MSNLKEDEKINSSGIDKYNNTGTSDLESIALGEGNVKAIFENEEIDKVYLAKSNLISGAFQEIGMGRYQWELFALAGFGWSVDNVSFVIYSL